MTIGDGRLDPGLVKVTKRKWLADQPGPTPVLGWTARNLGTDRYGTWLYCPQGSAHHRPDGTPVVLESAGIQLWPASGWWTAWWWQSGWIGAEVCTRPRITSTGWSYVDLELDVYSGEPGQAELTGAEEFEALLARDVLATRQIVGAARDVQWLLPAMRDRTGPFDARSWERFDRAEHLETER